MRYIKSNTALTLYTTSRRRRRRSSEVRRLQLYIIVATTHHATPTITSAKSSGTANSHSHTTRAALRSKAPSSAARIKDRNTTIPPPQAYYSCFSAVACSAPCPLQLHRSSWMRRAVSSNTSWILPRSSLPDCGVVSIATAAPNMAPPSAEMIQIVVFFIVVKFNCSTPRQSANHRPTTPPTATYLIEF